MSTHSGVPRRYRKASWIALNWAGSNRASLRIRQPKPISTAAVTTPDRVAGANAIHPGNGPLAEDPDFAVAVQDAGMIWIGAPPKTLGLLRSKTEAKAAVAAAQVPVLVTAGLGQASREAAYGADPAVLLKALAPRDSEQHPPRVLLIEERTEIALALTEALQRRGIQVARAASDSEAVTTAGRFHPNLVVMDLMRMHHHRAGIVDWLRANGQLNRTPLVVYTAAVDQADLPRLASGETVLFLAERSTSPEVQTRIVDLLARIGVN